MSRLDLVCGWQCNHHFPNILGTKSIEACCHSSRRKSELPCHVEFLKIVNLSHNSGIYSSAVPIFCADVRTRACSGRALCNSASTSRCTHDHRRLPEGIASHARNHLGHGARRADRPRPRGRTRPTTRPGLAPLLGRDPRRGDHRPCRAAAAQPARPRRRPRHGRARPGRHARGRQLRHRCRPLVGAELPGGAGRRRLRRRPACASSTVPLDGHACRAWSRWAVAR